MGIVIVAAGAQRWSQSFAALISGAICLASPAKPEEALYLVENDAAMKRMMSDMAVERSGDIDRDFVSMMSPQSSGRHRHGAGRPALRAQRTNQAAGAGDYRHPAAGDHRDAVGDR
jgi:hypothetical protein